jgi:hypothetical protein
MTASAVIVLSTGTAPSSAASKIKLYATTGNALAYVDPSNNSIVLNGGGVLSVSTPADPTGTTDTTGKMAGLAVSFTPATTGRVAINISGNATNSGATAGQGAKAQIRYGTSTAPTNGAALTGTTVGAMVTATLMRNTADLIPISLVGVITGLTLGTAYWLDLAEVALTSGTGQLKNLTVAIEEG